MGKEKTLNDKNTRELAALQNAGPATLRDLELLQIKTISDLAKADPDDLYAQLQLKTGMPQDPCVWDVFAAIIHEAKTGEKTPWWHWAPLRKNRAHDR